jgi:hypothetical protein
MWIFRNAQQSPMPRLIIHGFTIALGGCSAALR